MLIRVFEIPAKTGTFHFGGGEPQAFVEVDWFRDDEYSPGDDPAKWQSDMRGFIEKKRYSRGQPLLVLHPTHPFTINYEAP